MGEVLERGSNLGKERALTQLLFVTPAILDVVWLTAQKLLGQAKGFWGKYLSFEYAYELLKQGNMQLWLVNDNEGFFLAVLTEFRAYDKAPTCNFVCIGGAGMFEAFEHLETIEHWAKKCGAQETIVIGRNEWKSALRKVGYKPICVGLSKSLSNIKEH